MITLEQWSHAVKNNEKLWYVDNPEGCMVGVRLVCTNQHIKWDSTIEDYTLYCGGNSYIPFSYIFTSEPECAKEASKLLLKYAGLYKEEQ